MHVSCEQERWAVLALLCPAGQSCQGLPKLAAALGELPTELLHELCPQTV